MPKCKKCGAAFPSSIVVDGKKRTLCNRRYCFDCSPFGVRNNRQLERGDGEWRTCKYCQRDYLFTSNGRHSTEVCQTCMINIARYDKKVRAIEYKGGVCIKCGYDGHRCPGAMDFHHRDPAEKKFGIAGNYGLGWDKLVVELDKCDLYCCRCHAEVTWDDDQRRLKYERLGVETTQRRPEKTVRLGMRVCPGCNEEFRQKHHRQKYCGRGCGHRSMHKVEHPTREQLEVLIGEKSFVQIGRDYGVSDNAVRKWARSYGLIE